MLFAKALLEGCLFAKVLLVPFCKGFECTTFQQRQGENTFLSRARYGSKTTGGKLKSKPVDEYM